MIEWKTSHDLMPLSVAITRMEERVIGIHTEKQNELIWMLEHPHVYSGGRSSQDSHLLSKYNIPIEMTSRGGSYTYHGPGQRIIYVMLDLKKRGKDIRKFVWNLEQWIIDSLEEIGVNGERRSNRVGIWISPGDRKKFSDDLKPELKIASIGLRVKNWISYFGVSVNVNPDLKYFDGIIPCGNEGYGVTSMKQLGFATSLTELDYVLQQKFMGCFSSI